MKGLEPVLPGIFPLEEYLKPLEISQNKLAKGIGVCPARVNEICQCKRGITADTALRLSLYFGTTPEFWINFQKGYELDCVKLKELNTLKGKIIPFKFVAMF